MTMSEKLHFCWETYRDTFDDSITYNWYVKMTEDEFKYEEIEPKPETFEEYVDGLYEMYKSGEF